MKKSIFKPLDIKDNEKTQLNSFINDNDNIAKCTRENFISNTP